MKEYDRILWHEKQVKKKQVLKQKYPFEELLKLQHVIGYQVDKGEN